MCNTYLVLAYGLLWCIFMVYAVTIQRRQQRLEHELQELKNSVRGQEASGAGNS
jgi:CcmD family protein